MDLYSMQLNETMWINSNLTEVLRVAGGWIYRVFDSQTQRECVSQCFVPFNNEFQSDKPADRPEGEDYRTKYASLRSSAVQMVSYCNGLEQENADLKAEVERLRGDGWISVKERLPEKNIAVIVHISSGDIDVRVLGICDDDPNGLWYCCKGADEPLRFNEVTHWRPLPEPLRGE